MLQLGCLQFTQQKSFRCLPSRYYEFDDSIVREILGKKLSSRHRKDLDEVSEKTNVPLKSCRRQVYVLAFH